MPYLMLLRAHWKLVGLGLLCLALAIQTVRLGYRTNQLERERINLNEVRSQLKALEEESARRKAQQDKVLVEIRERRVEVEKRATEIENAPLPGNCKTPDAILREPNL